MIRLGDILQCPTYHTKVRVINLAPFTVRCISVDYQCGWEIGEVDARYSGRAYLDNNWEIQSTFRKYYEAI